MIVLGITGSIGTGKSTVMAMLHQLGVPTSSADLHVRHLLHHNQTVQEEVCSTFPFAEVEGRVSTEKLAALLDQADSSDLLKLEAILHPRVFIAFQEFLAQQRAARVPLVALEIPLLFEAGKSAALVDYIIVTHTGAAIQRHRVLQRPNMTPQRLFRILSRQYPNLEKIKRADYVIYTCKSFDNVASQVKSVLQDIYLKHYQV